MVACVHTCIVRHVNQIDSGRQNMSLVSSCPENANRIKSPSSSVSILLVDISDS